MELLDLAPSCIHLSDRIVDYSQAEELLMFGGSWFPLSDEKEGPIYRLRRKAPFWR